MTPLPEIGELVERFQRNLDSYKSPQYNETNLRREFLDPLFGCLGWDVANRAGLAEAYKDVVHEFSTDVEGSRKTPDYSFRIGGTPVFFVEAKKPAENLEKKPEWAYQLRRYGYSAGLPLSILTDFEEFAVYDCRVKPERKDAAGVARTAYVRFTENADRWDELTALFAKESVMRGSFDEYARSAKRKRGTAGVDADFLAEIEGWRDLLARNIALRNPGLTTRQLNTAVQSTIDRIIFLRICEDRGIEDYGRLMALRNGEAVYARMTALFRDADAKYNSGLFHFETEKGRGAPDELAISLAIDDKPLKDILRRLYYPECPYEFSVMPADILGRVYERFLGKVIRLTAGHRAVVEEKPEVKKAGGVYYTPEYIVDYIVQKTVGELVAGKTPKDVAKLKVLDPACGSGSFLIGAYQYLLDWHRDWYAANEPLKLAKAKQPVIYQGPGAEWKLTTSERKRILLNNIHGVDIDPQAVEVTKLSLLLKVLEGENEQSLNAMFSIFRNERVLPDLDRNIQCGNSLIGPDYYAGRQLSLLDDEEHYRVNAFDWKAAFPEVMGRGGFDAVIGNPPYVRQETLGLEFKEYAKVTYETYAGTADLYTYFIEKAMGLLRDGGLFSYIVANKWLRANYGEPLRRWLKTRRIEEIVDFGDLPVFQDATTYPCIIRMRGGSRPAPFPVTRMASLDFQDLAEAVTTQAHIVEPTGLQDSVWSLADGAITALLKKVRERGVPLGEYVKGQIYRGVLTGLNEAFVIDEETRTRLIAEDVKSAEFIRPWLVGKDIKRYMTPVSARYLIVIPKGWTALRCGTKGDVWSKFKAEYPALAKHLAPHAAKAEKRCDKGDYWWELRACDYYAEFEKPKILYAEIATRGQFTIDLANMYSDTTSYIMGTDSKYLLGVLNSSLFTLMFSHISSEIRGGFYRWKRQYMVDISICPIDPAVPEDVARHDRIVELVDSLLILNQQVAETKTAHERTLIERRIAAADAEIDAIVYDLYGLTEEEITVVEGR